MFVTTKEIRRVGRKEHMQGIYTIAAALEIPFCPNRLLSGDNASIALRRETGFGVQQEVFIKELTAPLGDQKRHISRKEMWSRVLPLPIRLKLQK